ncbi:hypothetical protein GBF38_007849 [Nibea albiflora]|uniref:Uncharacterized protein n=1 Tax=Nibea albiflora TaxID=240163 RepID=A0ACB7EQD8_NIBAL|nr:hypothetical protein GBF38_007849 [Nibea albiflora]
MIVRLAALILLTTLPQTKGIPQKIPSIVVKPGDDLTLTCPVSGDEAGLFYWYKKMFGYMIETVAVAALYKMSLQGQFDNPRFNLIKSEGLYFLSIKNVSHEDEGTYFCQSGAAYAMEFTNGTVLTVKDNKNQQKSVLVEQIPETESVTMGYQMSLQCSVLSKNKAQCPGDPDVYWFRAGSGDSHPSILYTYNRSSDEQEQRSCVYSLSKTVRDSSDTGSYYCAVVTCGQILFGEGTKVEITQTKGIPQKIPSIVVKPGDDLTLTCPVSGDEGGLFYWYKKMFGYMIETVAAGSTYKISLQGQFDSPRFTVTKSGALYFLNIKNASHEDEGTYFCQSGAAYAMTFTNGTVLTVKDHKNQQKSVTMNQSPETDSVLLGKGRQEWNPVIIVLGILLALCVIVIAVLILSKDVIQTADVPVPMSLTVVEADHNQQKSVDVKQSPETASVQLGDSVTLKCSLLSKNKAQCPGEPSVYWFRAGSGESHPAMIYTNSSCEEEQRSCVYSLSKTIRDSSDAGTYYCTVATYGQILFGEGTKMEIRPKLDPVDFVLGVLLACCVAVITVLIFCISRKRVCGHCNGSWECGGRFRLESAVQTQMSMRRFFRANREDDYSQIQYLTAKCTRLAHDKALLDREFLLSRDRERRLQNELEGVTARLHHQEQLNMELKMGQDQLVSKLHQQQYLVDLLQQRVVLLVKESSRDEELLRQVGSELLCLQSSEVKLEGLVEELHAEAHRRAVVAKGLQAELQAEAQHRAVLTESLKTELCRFKDSLMEERETLLQQVSMLEKKAKKLGRLHDDSPTAERLLSPTGHYML